MQHRFRLVAIYIALILYYGVPVTAVPQMPAALSGEALVEALRGGGYNLYFRHAATDWSLADHVRERGDLTPTACASSPIRGARPHAR